MKINFKTLGIAVLVIGSIVLAMLALTNDDKEDYFKEVELSNSNTVINSLNRMHYYDTILAVGMDVAGLNGITVILNDLSDAAKNQFNGELKAHIRLYNGDYYLFLGAMNRDEAITVVSHEIIHIQQYQSRDFIYENNEITWLGVPHSLDGDYETRPWERDAFEKQNNIEKAIRSVLY
jgi:hypothetical protein